MTRRRGAAGLIRDTRRPRTVAGWYHWALRNTTCRLGWHSRPKRRIHKFNGGMGAWLCGHCRVIVKTGHER